MVWRMPWMADCGQAGYSLNSRRLNMKNHHESLVVLIGFVLLFWLPAAAPAQTLPPLAKQLNPAETAILLIDFQNNFAAAEGEHYASYKKVFEETKMLENSVNLVKKARALGIQIVQVSEGYSADYRELDWS